MSGPVNFLLFQLSDERLIYFQLQWVVCEIKAKRVTVKISEGELYHIMIYTSVVQWLLFIIVFSSS